MERCDDWFDNKNGKKQINSIKVYSDLYEEVSKLIRKEIDADKIIYYLKKEAKLRYKARFGGSPTTGSLNNSSGRWNEFLATSFFCEITKEISESANKQLAVFSLPDSRVHNPKKGRISSQFLRLFEQSEFNQGNSLGFINEIKESIFFPSPDFVFVLLDKENPLVPHVQELITQQSLDPKSTDLFRFLEGKLKGKDVKGVASLKTSNRPDRRYQPSFEAAIIKSIGFTGKLSWKYFMVASNLSSTDKILFNHMIAPHSIALNDKEKLVDGVYVYRQKKDLTAIVQQMML